VAGELVAVAERSGEASLALWGRLLLGLGELETTGSRTATTPYADSAREIRIPPRVGFVSSLTVTAALRGGRLAEAETRLAETQAGAGSRTILRLNLWIQTLWLELLRGRPIAEETVAGPTSRTVPREYELAALALAAYLHSESGRLEPARKLFEVLATDGFNSLPDNMYRLFSLALLARVCARLENRVRAAALRERLRPFTGRCIVGGLVHYLGPVEHPLGLLAGTLSRFDEAARWFEAALAKEAAEGDRSLAVIARRDFAELLDRRGRASDLEPARRLRGEAREEARVLGMA
jgi:hypothetical protein